MSIIKMIKCITGLTQEALAEFLGVSVALVNLWENDGNVMTNYEKQIISEKFMVHLNILNVMI